MNGRVSWVVPAVAAAMASCSIEGREIALVRNVCDVDTASCGDDDAVECDTSLGLCVRQQALEPYEVVLQVTPADDSTGLVRRATYPPFTLRGALERALNVPMAVPLRGRVLASGDGAGRLIDAEVSFIPVESTPAGNWVVVSTRRVGADDGSSNLAAALAPNTSYRVRIQPLTQDSETLPPAQVSFRTGESSADFTYTYDRTALQAIAGRVIDENLQPQPGLAVRLQPGFGDGEEPVREVLSSTAITDQDGAFTLYAPAALSEDDYMFVLSLDADYPWTRIIAVPPARRNAQGVLTIPVVPQPVRFVGSVEESAQTVAQAELTFVSGFEVPAATGQLNDRDWCRAHLPGDMGPAYQCRATATTYVDFRGRFSVSLLPGDYKLFIAPSQNSRDGRVATRELSAIIETQPGGAPQVGQAYGLDPAQIFRGVVRSPRDRLMPDVTVQAVALSLAGELGAVARYNRTATDISDARGQLDLAVDTGYFDLRAVPPDDSGFAWLYLANRVIDPNLETRDAVLNLTLTEPVVVSGTVSGPDGPLPAAAIDAYAVVRDLQGGSRVVAVGRAIADEQGVYRLYLPPEVVDEGGA